MSNHLRFEPHYRGWDKQGARPGVASITYGERRMLEGVDKHEKHEFRSKAWYRARITLPKVSILGDRS